MFMNNLKETLNEDYNVSVTENGAVGYKTTGKNLLDMNFKVSSMRQMNEKQITDIFMKAFYENKMLAVKWLFFCRDIRGGMGERRTFRIIYRYLAENHPEIADSLMPLVAEYGRWDDLLCLFDTPLESIMAEYLNKRLEKDLKKMQENKPVSLLAKWLPSINTLSKEKVDMACKLTEYWNMPKGTYRKTLHKLRAYLKVVEVQMCANKWSEIEYSAVPSRANLFYNNAFLKHDEERRREYLSKLTKGEEKINAATLFPHDIVHKYKGSWYNALKPKDIVLEELWKALPNFVNCAGNTICVADGSGSMDTNVSSRTHVTALEVANALAIYFAEKSSGEFKDKYITFSMNPQLVDFSKCNSLKEKLEVAYLHSECSNTNIEAVFNLILTTALKHNMTQDELPQNILILSDMEFDSCARTSSKQSMDYFWNGAKVTENLFKVIKNKYEKHGYKLPRLIFWNICSRTGTIPVKENELGVALVSGFSPAIVKMVLSNELDPFKCLLEQLNSVRYDDVEVCVKNALKHEM